MTKRGRRSRRGACCLCSGIFITILFLIFLIALTVALTVYKPKKLVVWIQSATIEGVASRVFLPLDVQLNFTLDLQILVENRNRLSFTHGIGKTLVAYREKQVGGVDLPSGTFPARRSSILPCRLTLQIEKFVANLTGIIQDILGGKFVVETNTKIPGKVKLFGIFNKHIDAISDCKLTIGFPSMKVQNQECEMNTKL